MTRTGVLKGRLRASVLLLSREAFRPGDWVIPSKWKKSFMLYCDSEDVSTLSVFQHMQAQGT